MGTDELRENAVWDIATAEREGRLEAWAKTLTDDARLVLRLLPFGGHVRVLKEAEEAEARAAAQPGGSFTVGLGANGGLVIGGSGLGSLFGPMPDDAVEPLTVREDQLTQFFRASGCGRLESKSKSAGALAELMLRGLVRSFQDDGELARYALTVEGARIKAVLFPDG